MGTSTALTWLAPVPQSIWVSLIPSVLTPRVIKSPPSVLPIVVSSALKEPTPAVAPR